MTRILLAFVCLCAVCAVADAPRTMVTTNGVSQKKVSPEEFQKMLIALRMKKTGGFVRKDGSAKGAFILLNGQKSVAREELAAALATIDRQFKVMTGLVDCDGIDAVNVREKIVAAGGRVGVAVVESKTLPSLLAAPESGWVLVNVSALMPSDGNAKILATRVRKEVLRGFAFVTGGCYSLFGDFLMHDVAEVEQLDAVGKEEFSIAAIQRIMQALPNYGVTPWHETTYLKACEEGWAPAPTNEFQKAIWDKVHAIPQKPIKIEYNEKRDKGK